MLAEEGGRREALEGGRDLDWREFDIRSMIAYSYFGEI